MIEWFDNHCHLSENIEEIVNECKNSIFIFIIFIEFFEQIYINSNKKNLD